MKIAHIVASLDRRYGGPSRSVRSLAQAQADLGLEVELLTLAAEPQEEQQGNLHVRTFRLDRPAAIAPSGAMRDHLRISRYAILHVHGIWLRPLHYARAAATRQSIPLVIAPRGMMTSWAWNHHRSRKALAAALVHPGAFRSASGWHATSKEEAAEIHARGYTQATCLSPNGVSVPSPAERDAARAFWTPKLAAHRGRRIALFYSRFHRKKRVTELIELWHRLAPTDWVLLLVGIPDEYSVAQLQAAATRSDSRASVLVADGTDAPPPYAIADLLLLGSHSENFGLVVAESLASAVPCLVTNGLPWDELNTRGAGWCVDWEQFPAILREALSESSESLRARGNLGPDWMRAAYGWKQCGERLIEFYRQLGARG